MKKINQLFAFLLLCFLGFNTYGQINNGTFESWSGASPDGWTTIDGGVSINQNSTIVKEGTYSAGVSVNTSSQDNTDIRQSISVNSGQNYTFSVWVYHTEGGVRLRLYVDGYQVYSDPSLTNQWQQVTFSHTPSTSSIEVGMRFYDVSGFDGSEIVYVDDYQPATGDGVGGSCSETEVVLSLVTDNYGSETSWELKDTSGNVLYSGNGYANNSSYSETFCLTDGAYNFIIYDSYGDGICCSQGNGSYTLTSDGVTLGSGGNFGSSETASFTIESGGSDDGGGSSCTNTEAALSLTTDNYGSETSWELKDSSGNTLYSGSGYASNSSYAETFCLVDGSYDFTIFDTYGDGICCAYGEGSYSLTSGGNTLGSGGAFGASETVSFTIGTGGGGDSGDYYSSAEGLSGFTLKTALYNIINDHTSQGYSALWDFYAAHELDSYYENDGSILDIYSEDPSGTDPYNFTKSTNQCGTYSNEGDCYNREHSFPRSWFGGSVEPMNSDVHHIFASDGYVNGKRSSYPYGEVGSASYVSENGSRLGTATSGLGYSGTVFEPIDEFKGDLARAMFYMATRYENVIGSWETNSSYGDAVLNGTSDQVFESWAFNMLVSWHNSDPVSAKEVARNEAAYSHQGNRNPFVDHPEYVSAIWGSGSTFARVAGTSGVHATYNQEHLIVTHGIGRTVDVTVFDGSGRKIVSWTCESNQSPITAIPVQLNTNTLYIIKVYTDDKMMSKKIMIWE